MSAHPEPSTPLDARMRRSRGALHEALLGLLVEKPFDQLTVREIAARAGIGYATFFRHYPAKEALLDALASAEIATLLGLSLPVLLETDDSRASTVALCAYVDRHRALWTALLTGGAAGIVREAFVRQARLIPARASPRDWLPGDLRTIHATSATVDILAWWLKEGAALSVERIADILDRLVIAPTLSAAAGGRPG